MPDMIHCEMLFMLSVSFIAIMSLNIGNAMNQQTRLSSIATTLVTTHNIQMWSTISLPPPPLSLPPEQTTNIYSKPMWLMMIMLMLMLFSFTICRRRTPLNHPPLPSLPPTHLCTHNEDVKVIKSDQLTGSAGGKLPSIRRKPEYISVFENRCGTNVSKVRTSGR